MATYEDSTDSLNSGFTILTGAVVLVALGHLALLVVFPDGLSLSTLLAVETLTLGVFVGAELLTGTSARQTAGLVVIFAVAMGLTWGLQQVIESLLVVTALLGACFALTAYGLHRYELVVLGLAEEVTDGEQ